ncbi:hypothetical protein DFJ73DRAFT_786166 [Zopfochytrium polystomum]|nr:hypothetical protein DFJ73DRAFT_786166 [Zopfochytrium polystomum]
MQNSKEKQLSEEEAKIKEEAKTTKEERKNKIPSGGAKAPTDPKHGRVAPRGDTPTEGPPHAGGWSPTPPAAAVEGGAAGGRAAEAAQPPPPKIAKFFLP